MTIEIASDLYRAGRIDEAEGVCRRILACDPWNAPALSLFGLLLHKRGQTAEAVELLQRALRLEPESPGNLGNLAFVLGQSGKHGDAARLLERALEVGPRSPQVLHNLGVAYESSGQTERAERVYREAIAAEPAYAEAYHSLGNLLRKSGCLEEAIGSYRKAIALRPGFAAAFGGLAAALWPLGDRRAVIDAYRSATLLDRRRPQFHSGLIFAMFHDPAYSAADRLREAISWNELHAQPLGDSIAPFRNGREPERRLRIGYVSPDFVEHPGARMALPIIRSHDRGAFEVFCYADLQRSDAMTERVRAAADGWRDITRLWDQQAADAIRGDGIDVLIDLAGHMGRSRLAIFARKPAPIQVQLTFPGTTGLAAMDYRVTDAISDPPGIGERHHTERLIRLPCAWCYDPGDLPPVGPLPALRRNGAVTFGCLNRPMKITTAAVSLWASILRALPGSRMVLLSGTTNGQNAYLTALLQSHGLDERQVRLIPRVPRARYIELFNEIDIALDPFPYNGEATTLDGLWMGVPLITLAGNSFVSRRGVSHLTQANLGDLIARDAADYARIAIELGQNVPRLAALRSSLRENIQSSPVGRPVAYTADFECAIREAWTNWCRDMG